MRNKLLVLLTIIVSAVSLSGAAVLASTSTWTGFKDVADTHWASSTIEWAVELGVVNGYTDGTFRPENAVTEPEFLAMLFRAYPEISIPQKQPDEAWDAPYFYLGEDYNWPVWHESDGKQYNRGRVAEVLAASQGHVLPTNEAVQFILDREMANGKTSATVEGFGVEDKLTRAQAVTLIRNMKDRKLTLSKGVAALEPEIEGLHVRGIQIGDSEENVLAKHGQPLRKDSSEYGFQWYIYHDEYKHYMQVGVSGGEVVALYTNSTDWKTEEGVTLGTASSQVKKLYGEQLTYILKGNTRYRLNGVEESPKYLMDGSYVTFFLDAHKASTVTAVLVIEEDTELSLQGYYGEASDALVKSYERQVFDLANATRVRFGLEALEWDDKAAASASKHSQDMAVNDFFNHENLKGETPFQRMEAEGIQYAYASENIAAGQTNAIFAHESWMNSKSGHREGILSTEPALLGVGVYMGGGMKVYYTQNFYTAL